MVNFLFKFTTKCWYLLDKSECKPKQYTRGNSVLGLRPIIVIIYYSNRKTLNEEDTQFHYEFK